MKNIGQLVGFASQTTNTLVPAWLMRCACSHVHEPVILHAVILHATGSHAAPHTSWVSTLGLVACLGSLCHMASCRSQAQHGEATLADTLAKASKATSELTTLRSDNQMLMQVSQGTAHVRACL